MGSDLSEDFCFKLRVHLHKRDARGCFCVPQQLREGNKYQGTFKDGGVQFEHLGQGDRRAELPLGDSGCPSPVP